MSALELAGAGISTLMRRRASLGILSCIPVLYIVFFFVVVGASVATHNGHSGGLPIPFGLLFAMHISVMVLIIVLLVIFIKDAYGNPRVDENKRAFWAIVLFLGNAIAMPIYWWLYIKASGKAPTRIQGASG